MTPFMRGAYSTQIHKDRTQDGGCQGLEGVGRGGGSYCLMGTGFHFADEKSSRDGCTAM